MTSSESILVVDRSQAVNSGVQSNTTGASTTISTPNGQLASLAAFHAELVVKVLRNFDLLINNLIEFFNLNGVLNPFFSLKLIHLKQAFKEVFKNLNSDEAIEKSGNTGAASAQGNKRMKLDATQIFNEQKFVLLNTQLLNLLKKFKLVLVEIIQVFNKVNLQSYVATQLNYRILTQASNNKGKNSDNDNTQLTSTIAVYVENLFSTQFFSKNLSNLEELISTAEKLASVTDINANASGNTGKTEVKNKSKRNLDDDIRTMLEKIASLDNALVQFNIINSIGFYEFKILKQQINPSAHANGSSTGSSNGMFNFGADLRFLRENSTEFNNFVVEKTSRLQHLYDRQLFN